MKPCLKADVMAMIVDHVGQVATGTNEIQNEFVKKCPRELGEDYTKCKTICQQESHAEIAAIKKAKERGLILEGSKLYLTGHNKPCYNCRKACEKEGITIITMGDVS